MKTQQSYRQIYGLILIGIIAFILSRGINCVQIPVDNANSAHQIVDSSYQYLPPAQPLPMSFYSVDPSQQMLPAPISYQNTYSVFVAKKLSNVGSADGQESKNVPSLQNLPAKETPLITDHLQQYPVAPQVIHHYHYQGPVVAIVPPSIFHNVNSEQQQKRQQQQVTTNNNSQQQLFFAPATKTVEYSKYLSPAGYIYMSQQQQQQQQKQLQTDNSATLPSISLPEGYVAIKPEGAEEAIKELHTLPDESDEIPAGNTQQQQQHIATQYLSPKYLPPLK